MKIFFLLFCISLCGQQLPTYAQEGVRVNNAQLFEDWSIFNASDNAVRGPEAGRMPIGGILLQWTQEGLDYMSFLTKRTFMRLMTGMQFPDNKAEDGSFSATNIKVKEFQEPRVVIKFLTNTGIGAKILLPKLDIEGDYLMDQGFLSSEGKIRAFATNVLIQVLMKVERGSSGHPTFEIPYCDAKIQEFRISFSDTDSWAGSMLNSFRAGIESFVSTQMGDLMCASARNMTEVFEILFIDPWSGPWMFDPDVMCPNMPADAATATGAPEIKIPKTGSAIADRLLERVHGFTVDIRLSDRPKFDDNRLTLPLKGDFYYEKFAAPVTPQRIDFPKANEMIKFAITEHLPNTFLYHVYRKNLTFVEENLDMKNLPARVRHPLRLVCWNCRVKILGAAAEPPKIRMTPQGVKIIGKGWVKVTARGFFHTFNVITGTAEIEAGLKFRVTNNVIYGDLTLDRLRVQVSSTGLAGLIAASLAQTLEELIPQKIWPRLHAPVHQAIGVKGIPLPEVCGLSFNNTAISFYNGYVSVGSDLVYDIDGFLNRLERSLARQKAAADAAAAAAQTTQAPW